MAQSFDLAAAERWLMETYPGVRVTSGKRTRAENARLPGAAKNSMHLDAKALDFVPPPGVRASEIKAAASAAGYPIAEWIDKRHGTGPHVHWGWRGADTGGRWWEGDVAAARAQQQTQPQAQPAQEEQQPPYRLVPVDHDPFAKSRGVGSRVGQEGAVPRERRPIATAGFGSGSGAPAAAPKSNYSNLGYGEDTVSAIASPPPPLMPETPNGRPLGARVVEPPEPNRGADFARHMPSFLPQPIRTGLGEMTAGAERATTGAAEAVMGQREKNARALIESVQQRNWPRTAYQVLNNITQGTMANPQSMLQASGLAFAPVAGALEPLLAHQAPFMNSPYGKAAATAPYLGAFPQITRATALLNDVMAVDPDDLMNGKPPEIDPNRPIEPMDVTGAALNFLPFPGAARAARPRPRPLPNIGHPPGAPPASMGQVQFKWPSTPEKPLPIPPENIARAPERLGREPRHDPIESMIDGEVPDRTFGWRAREREPAAQDEVLYQRKTPNPDRPPFFYELENAIAKVNSKQMAGADWWNHIGAREPDNTGTIRIRSKLPGVKPDELEWTRVEEWLKAQEGPVTKDALLGYLRKSRLNWRTVRVGEAVDKPRLDALNQERKQLEAEIARINVPLLRMDRSNPFREGMLQRFQQETRPFQERLDAVNREIGTLKPSNFQHAGYTIARQGNLAGESILPETYSENLRIIEGHGEPPVNPADLRITRNPPHYGEGIALGETTFEHQGRRFGPFEEPHEEIAPGAWRPVFAEDDARRIGVQQVNQTRPRGFQEGHWQGVRDPVTGRSPPDDIGMHDRSYGITLDGHPAWFGDELQAVMYGQGHEKGWRGVPLPEAKRWQVVETAGDRPWAVLNEHGNTWENYRSETDAVAAANARNRREGARGEWAIVRNHDEVVVERYNTEEIANEALPEHNEETAWGVYNSSGELIRRAADEDRATEIRDEYGTQEEWVIRGPNDEIVDQFDTERAADLALENNHQVEAEYRVLDPEGETLDDGYGTETGAQEWLDTYWEENDIPEGDRAGYRVEEINDVENNPTGGHYTDHIEGDDGGYYVEEIEATEGEQRYRVEHRPQPMWRAEHRPTTTASVRQGPDGDSYSDYTESQHGQDYRQQAEREAEQKNQTALTSGLPNVPFKAGWWEPMFKMLIEDAIQKGYNTLAWSSGQLAAERWAGSHPISEVKVTPEYIVRDPEGKTIASGLLDEAAAQQRMSEYFTKKKVPEDKREGYAVATSSRVIMRDAQQESYTYPAARQGKPKPLSPKDLFAFVGDEAAAKIAADIQAGAFEKDLLGNIEGKTYDIEPVNSGYRSDFLREVYDIFFPAFVNKYIKKWGGKLERVRMPMSKPDSIHLFLLLPQSTHQGILHPESQYRLVGYNKEGGGTAFDRYLMTPQIAQEIGADLAERLFAGENAGALQRGNRVQIGEQHGPALFTPPIKTRPIWKFHIPEAMHNEIVDKGQAFYQRRGSKGTEKAGDDVTLYRRGEEQVTGTPPDEMTARDQAINDWLVQDTARLSPKSHIVGFGKISENGQSVSGFTLGGQRGFIAWALDSSDPRGTWKHEFIHELKTNGFFSPGEWKILEETAQKQGWIKRYKIDELYGDKSPQTRLHEAIAERASDFARGLPKGFRGKLPVRVQKVFERLATLKERAVAWLRKQYGAKASANDIFLKVFDTGEIGNRPQPKERSGRQPFRGMYQREGGARKSGPVFYSALERAVEQVGLNKGTPDQWRKTVTNPQRVKPEEAEAIGLTQWLDQQTGTITKAQVLDYIKQNKLEINDKVYGAGAPVDLGGPIERTKFDAFTSTPEKGPFAGRNTYSEHLLNLKGNKFDSPHWPGNNPVAHGRKQGAVDTKGVKTFIIEEVQSEQHEKARQVGSDDKTPFRATWPELVFKRMLRRAVDEGYDQIAWTTGDMQVERYNLARQFDAIGYRKNADGTYDIFVQRAGTGPGAMREPTLPSVSADRLTATVSDGLAARMKRGEGSTMEGAPGDVMFFQGDELKGGEGLQRLYDQMLPQMVNRYMKKRGWNAKVETTTIMAGGKEREFHAVKITPEIADSVVEGQPMFQRRQSDTDAAPMFGHSGRNARALPLQEQRLVQSRDKRFANARRAEQEARALRAKDAGEAVAKLSVAKRAPFGVTTSQKGVRSRSLPSFWKSYRALPDKLKKLSDDAWRVFQTDHTGKGIKFQKRNDGLWSYRVSEDWRVYGVVDADGAFNKIDVVPHREYDKLDADRIRFEFDKGKKALAARRRR